MEALTSVTGVAAPLMQINIDTDQIIPTTFLGGTDAKGYGEHVFHGWRFRPDGSRNPDFILNRPPFDNARILLADRNFGCGSSRERAVWALREFGIQAVIAPSFGEIFFNNCWRNGVVPVVMPIDGVNKIVAAVERSDGAWDVTVNLETLAVTSGEDHFIFNAPPAFREMLLKGLDEIQLTLSRGEAIRRFREADRVVRPWAYFDLPPPA
ncbi:3-isopropylmalate dehydratase small subunit [Paralcaligenes ginsengisoli]